MADKKDNANSEVDPAMVEQIRKDEEKINKLIDKVNEEITVEISGRPFLLVFASLHEIERKGTTSKIAAQLNWRSNINPKTEGRDKASIEAGQRMATFLTEQLDSAINDPQNGIKKAYDLK